jgi:hypothetical protein
LGGAADSRYAATEISADQYRLDDERDRSLLPHSVEIHKGKTKLVSKYALTQMKLSGIHTANGLLQSGHSTLESAAAETGRLECWATRLLHETGRS